MKAFKGKVNKDEFIKEIKWHMEQDAFMRGTYTQNNKNNFKGCAVGCSINSINRLLGTAYDYDEHIDMAETLQIPEWLVRLEDKIFEGLSEKDSKEWPLRFSEAINVGADLDKIKPAFLVYVLESIPGTHEVVHRAIALWKRDDLYSNAWKKESRAVYDAAANAAADTANAANAANAAAAYAAYADTADTADYAANAYAAYAVCAGRERGEIYKRFSDKLIELMRECK
jgi:hypothetical protein